MIKVGGTEIDVIKVGGTTPDMIYVGGSPVWPSGYYYTLTLKSSQPIYSNTGTSNGTLYASASNYATFYCTYSKKRTSNNAVVSTEDVYAIPSADYFNTNGTQLKFDKSNYGTTQFGGGTRTATLTYGAAEPIDASFNFYGNNSHKNYVSPTWTYSADKFPAGGADVSVNDGYSYLHWDSDENSGKTYLDWVDVSTMHPSGQPVRIMAYNHTLTVPNLGTHVTSETTYTLKVSTDNSAPYITVTQAANTRTPIGGTSYDVINTDTSTNTNSYYQCAASFNGYLNLRIDMTTGGYEYTSGETEPGATTQGITVTPTVQYQTTSFVSTSPNATSSPSIYISRNTSSSSRSAQVTFTYNNTIVAGLYISQYGA